ncbi:MAG TPA: Holliday junction branch migration protein RuvA [Candidatus Paceibacterota bacterium]|nr:Holliday junction branch migration protein RuvA [Candidatus Paceibacterota bacterium]
MIAQIEGKITHIGDKFLIINVSGLGFKVFVTKDLLFQFEKEGAKNVSLHTYLSVKEDALDLYGFENLEDLNFFEKIISVSGIGPKKALGIMSIAPVQTLKKAISSKDISYLTQVSGIGAKNAEKIVLELRDKMKGEDGDGELLKEESDVIMAIKSLGYTANDARKALKNIPADIKGVSQRVKWVLKELGK